MSKLRAVKSPDGSVWGYSFDCPGCKDSHSIPTTGGHPWAFNGDLERPTFMPSILVRWKTQEGDEATEHRCHSFVTDGRIAFCTDSGHALAGQTVDLPDMESA